MVNGGPHHHFKISGMYSDLEMSYFNLFAATRFTAWPRRIEKPISPLHH